ncbi:efflux RND transporter permease subunit [Shewanella gelidii]|uniref:Acriflavine resistance protein B n=1 Tax=Shewanella gelidii TaxID=1642821 RepID=A0A917NCM3_9GAMM|nr:efflux RND transporter permease subunit [Shewanella gelidii]MCL1098876.1 efflux RND transporter permease subunit [Shewanella gelidii]GGI89594.1 acriflavine resistance protein B [Shewanella gelidii]
MDLTQASTRNPAGTLVALLLICVFGALAILELPIQLLPDIQRPQITIFNNWRSAAPQEMESNIIEPQENVLRQVPGVVEMTSRISQGSGGVTLTFEVGSNMQTAMIDVINALNQTPPRPLDANEPFINVGGGRGTPNLASILIRMAPDNPATDFSQYQKLIDDVIEPRLRQITGVGSVNLQSRRPKELHIEFDPYRAAALGITLDQLRSTLSRAADISGGTANVGRRQYTVRFIGQYTPENLGQLIVTYNEGRPVYLNELADVSIGSRDFQGFTKRNGYTAYYLTVEGTFDANTVTVLDGINQAITELNTQNLAEHGLIMELSFDASIHIKRAILLVKGNLAIGVILALVVLFAFLRSAPATLMIASTIPVALLIAIMALEAMGRSLNVISLAGLAFAVGLVLDAAIIVQENIVRLVQQGKSLSKAVLQGAAQVKGALLASTATTVAIFLPVLFMPGVEGQLFSDLALTLSVAVVSSFLSAITLIPVFSLLWLKLPEQKSTQTLWLKLTHLVKRLTATRQLAAVWVLILVLGSGILTLLLMPRPDFLPQARSDGIFAFFSLPPGANIQTLEKEIGQTIIQRLKPYYEKEQQPFIKGYNFSMYAAFNVLFIYPEDPTQADEMIRLLNEEILIGLPDTQAFTNRGSLLQFGFNGGRAINIDLQGPDMEALMASAAKGMSLINTALPGAVVRPIPGLSMAQPELQFVPNERRLAQAGVDRIQIANAIRAYTSGLFVGEYFDGNERMDILLRGPKWQVPEQLAATPVYTAAAGIQTIGELASIHRTVGPTQLQRVNGKRSVSLLIFPPADMSLDEALETIKSKALTELKASLPENSAIQFRGSADKLDQTIKDMGMNFLLAVVILFLLMAAMFKSATDSALVLLSMPLAICGGVVSLRVLNLFSFQSLDLLTMIGFIILLGLVVNNAILLVDQTRQGARDGLDIDAAIYQAVQTRARPVYMSTLTSIFGMLPLMLVPGVGSEIYRGLAAVIVGGMSFSALFTLILMPSLLRLTATSAAAVHLSSAKHNQGLTE